MEVCSFLFLLFLIGGVGVFRVTRKIPEAKARKAHWLKFLVYVVLVFTQLWLLLRGWYFGFALMVVIPALYELIRVGETMRSFATGLTVFVPMAAGYLWFFSSDNLAIQQFLLVAVISFDGYSQICGQLFGKTKLFPQTSPAKTVEGSIGGFFLVGITSVPLAQILGIPLLPAVADGFLISVLALGGDFLASFYKRWNSVKDFSRLIPGHGGVLDRFDSLVASAFGMGLLSWVASQDQEVYHALGYVLVFLLLFAVAEGLRHFGEIKVEVTRKLVHFGSGLIALSFPFFLTQRTSVLLLCAGFTLILLLSRIWKLLPSVNAVDRKTQGSLLFPVAVFTCFLWYSYSGDYADFFLPLTVLAVCDPVAALVGKRWPIGCFRIGSGTKTVVGSLAFFLSCLLLLIGATIFFGPGFSVKDVSRLIGLAAVACAAEALSSGGWDNLSIPLTIILCQQLSGV